MLGLCTAAVARAAAGWRLGMARRRADERGRGLPGVGWPAVRGGDRDRPTAVSL